MVRLKGYSYKKKFGAYLFWFFLLIFLMLFSSCDMRYNYTKVNIVNNYNVGLVYKGLVIDEQSGDQSGDLIIKVVHPNINILYPTDKDAIDFTWKDGYKSIRFSLTWGFYDASTDSYNCYDYSTPYFELYDNQDITVRIDNSTDYLIY